MSRKFLTNIDLDQNQLLNGVIHNLTEDPGSGVEGQVYFNTTDQVLKIYNGSASAWQAVGSEEYIGDAVADLITAGNGISVDYDDPNDTLTIANTGVLSVAGTDSEVTVSASAGNVTIGLPDSVQIANSLAVNPGGGGAPGSFEVYTNSVTSNVATTVNSTLNVTGTAEFGDLVNVNATISNSSVLLQVPLDVNSNADIAGRLDVGASAYFADDLEVQGDVTIHGDLNVDGTVNAINRTEINLEDSSIRLNSNLSASATPVSNAELIVERGAESDVAIRWNETSNKWELTNDGANYAAIIATDDLTEDVEDIVGNLIQGSSTLNVNYVDDPAFGNERIELTAILQSSSPSYMLQANGLAVDIPTLETKLISDSFTRKAAANVGNGVNTQFALVHNFNTRDVVVNVYDAATFDTVEVDVVRTDADTVTVTFADAPGASAYRVVIIG